MVSTVWVGVDLGGIPGRPILFETMAFPEKGSHPFDCARYSTEEEALRGHEEMVRKWSAKALPN